MVFLQYILLILLAITSQGYLRINTDETAFQGLPVVTSLTNGGFAAAWLSKALDNSTSGLYIRIFDETGTPLAAEFRVNDASHGMKWKPSITSLANGNFVVAWDNIDEDETIQAYFRIYEADGTPVNSRSLITTRTSSSHGFFPLVLGFSDDGFVALYRGSSIGSNYYIYLMPFSDTGSKEMSEERQRQLSKSNFYDPDSYYTYPYHIQNQEGKNVLICGRGYWDAEFWFYRHEPSDYDNLEVGFVRDHEDCGAIYNGDTTYYAAAKARDDDEYETLSITKFDSDLDDMLGFSLIIHSQEAGEGEWYFNPKLTRDADGLNAVIFRTRDISTGEITIKVAKFNDDLELVQPASAIPVSVHETQGAHQVTKLTNGKYIIVWQVQSDTTDFDVEAIMLNENLEKNVLIDPSIGASGSGLQLIFDSLYQAIVQIKGGEYFLKKNGANDPHYLIYDENVDINTFKDQVITTELSLSPLKITTYECTVLITNDCYDPGEKATILVKSFDLMFDLTVTASFTFENVIIDAAEAITKFNNKASTNVHDCSTTRQQCCPDDSEFSPVHGDVRCIPDSSTFEGDEENYWIKFNSAGSHKLKVNFINCELKNFKYYQLGQIFKASGEVEFYFENTFIEETQVLNGMITTEDGQLSLTGSSLTITNSAGLTYPRPSSFVQNHIMNTFGGSVDISDLTIDGFSLESGDRLIKFENGGDDQEAFSIDGLNLHNLVISSQEPLFSGKTDKFLINGLDIQNIDLHSSLMFFDISLLEDDFTLQMIEIDIFPFPEGEGLTFLKLTTGDSVTLSINSISINSFEGQLTILDVDGPVQGTIDSIEILSAHIKNGQDGQTLLQLQNQDDGDSLEITQLNIEQTTMENTNFIFYDGQLSILQFTISDLQLSSIGQTQAWIVASALTIDDSTIDELVIDQPFMHVLSGMWTVSTSLLLSNIEIGIQQSNIGFFAIEEGGYDVAALEIQATQMGEYGSLFVVKSAEDDSQIQSLTITDFTTSSSEAFIRLTGNEDTTIENVEVANLENTRSDLSEFVFLSAENTKVELNTVSSNILIPSSSKYPTYFMQATYGCEIAINVISLSGSIQIFSSIDSSMVIQGITYVDLTSTNLDQIKLIDTQISSLLIINANFDFTFEDNPPQSIIFFNDLSSKIEIRGLILEGQTIQKGNFLIARKSQYSLKDITINNLKYLKGHLITSKSALSESIENLVGDGISTILDSQDPSQTSITGIQITNIDPQQNSYIFTMKNSPTIRVKALTVSKHEDASIRGIVKIDGFERATFEDILLSDLETTQSSLNIKGNSLGYLEIKNTTLEGLTSTTSHGGAIYVSGINYGLISFSKLRVQECKSAIGHGGAIYLDASLDDGQTQPVDFEISSSQFISNIAEGFGGAIYIMDSPPNIAEDVLFRNNQHQHTKSEQTQYNDLSSNPAQLKLFYGLSISEIEQELSDLRQISRYNSQLSQVNYLLDEMKPGRFNEELIYCAILDLYSNIVSYDSTSILKIKSISGDISIKTSSIKAQNGIYDLSQMNIKAKPNTEAIVSLTSNIVESITPIEVQINFVGCDIGDVISEDGDSCTRCPENTYVVNVDGDSKTSCEPCDQSRMICNGGSEVIPKTGNWKMNDTADIILECLTGDACQTNVDERRRRILDDDDQVSGISFDLLHSCKEGYKGNMCSNCEEGYGKTRDKSECFECDSEGSIYVQLLFAILLTLFTIVFSYKLTKKFPSVLSSPSADRVSIYIASSKIFISYIQTVGIFAGIIGVGWPRAISVPQDIDNYLTFSNSDGMSLDCFLNGIKGEMPIYYLGLLFTNLFPIMVLIVGGLMIKFINRRDSDGNCSSLITCFTIIVIYNQQPGIIEENLKTFLCQNLYRADDPEYYLIQDTNLKCWEGTHLAYSFGLSFPLLLIWCILIPILALRSLKANKFALSTSHKTIQKLSYLYRGFKTDKYYWEMIIYVRKLLLILIALLGSIDSTELSLYCSIYVLWVFYSIHQSIRPYSLQQLNDLESLSLICLHIVTISGVYYQNINENRVIEYMVIITQYASHLYFLIKTSLLVIKTFKQKANLKLEENTKKEVSDSDLSKTNFKPIFPGEDKKNNNGATIIKLDDEIDPLASKNMLTVGALESQKSPMAQNGYHGDGFRLHDTENGNLLREETISFGRTPNNKLNTNIHTNFTNSLKIIQNEGEEIGDNEKISSNEKSNQQMSLEFKEVGSMGELKDSTD